MKTETTFSCGDAPDIERLFTPTTYMSTWASPEAFARRIKSINKKDAWQKTAWETVNYGDEGDGWSGTKTMEGALELMENGWKEGADLIERVRTQILAQNPIRKKAVVYGIVGGVPDVPRAVAGDLKNMKDMGTTASRRRPVITLLCNMAANCGVSATAISNRAAAVAAVVDEIEAAGFSCEVITTATTAGGGWDGQKGFSAMTSIVIKRSDQPVDILKMAYTLGHASMFRRMIFADWGINQECKTGLGQCLGHSYSDDFDSLREKNIYSIPSAEECREKFKDETTTATVGLKFLVDGLRKQGCPAFPKWEEPPPTPESSLDMLVVKKKKKRRGEY